MAETARETDTGTLPTLQTPSITIEDAMSSNPQRPSIKRHNSELHSTLDESTYDLLSDVSSQISDDDGRTTSVASTTDDVTSLAGSDDEQEQELDEDAHEPHSMQSSMQETQYTEGVDSAITARALSSPSIPSASTLITETRVDRDDGEIALSQTLARFESSYIPEPFGSLTPQLSQLDIIVKQSISKTHFHIQRPFRLLYIGDRDSRVAVIHQFDLALAVTDTRSAGKTCDYFDDKFPTKHSNNLVHEECTDIQRREQDGIMFTELEVDDGSRWMRFSDRLGVQALGYPAKVSCLPDLVVLCYTSDKSTNARLDLTREALEAQSVPVLIMSTLTPFEQPFTGNSYDPKSLHMLFEGRMSSHDVSGEILGVGPVHTDFFLQMDPDTLNRHLACIVPELEAAMSPYQMVKSFASSLRKSILRVLQKTPLQDRWRYFLRPVLVFLLFTSAVSLWSIAQILSGSTSPVQYESFPLAPPTHSVTSSSTMTKEATLRPTAEVQSSISSVGHPLIDVQASIPPPPEKFEVHAMGEHHLLITEPRSLIKMRRPPRVHISISRDGAPLDWELIDVQEGLKSVVLKREQAFGIVNVTLWTTGKPRLSQTTEINLGSSWSNLSWIQQALRLKEAWTEGRTVPSNKDFDDTGLAQDLLNATRIMFETLDTMLKNNLLLQQTQLALNITLKKVDRFHGAIDKVMKGIDDQFEKFIQAPPGVAIPAKVYHAIGNSGPVQRAKRNGRALLNKISRRKARFMAKRAELQQRRADSKATQEAARSKKKLEKARRKAGKGSREI